MRPQANSIMLRTEYYPHENVVETQHKTFNTNKQRKVVTNFVTGNRILIEKYETEKAPGPDNIKKTSASR